MQSISVLIFFIISIEVSKLPINLDKNLYFLKVIKKKTEAIIVINTAGVLTSTRRRKFYLVNF